MSQFLNQSRAERKNEMELLVNAIGEKSIKDFLREYVGQQIVYSEQDYK
jgi:hypothetical protein